MHDQRPVALIPAYKPEADLIDITKELVRSCRFQKVVVVNDGSGSEFEAIFHALENVEGVELLEHHVNLGKGAALKNGLNHIACKYQATVGVVTLDADGQHLVEDVIRVARKLIDEPNKLILGSREFRRDVPLRSRFGNLMTRNVMRVLAGFNLRDTQTGLRGIPRDFIDFLLRLKTTGYDFELDMLLMAKEQLLVINEVPIQTVYINENKSSHFNPIVDSMRIYFIFIRYCSSSFLSVIIDYIFFSASSYWGAPLWEAIICGRFAAISIGFGLNKKLVFRSKGIWYWEFIRYLTVVILFAIIVYFAIQLLNNNFGINILVSKLIVESVLFFCGFAISNIFIFSKGEDSHAVQ
jgi:putative flippase GtrA